tara:strand:+ start:3453 stop:4379 length:927 start_codon:yes stop_codon:yes gene_type:complete
MNSINQLNLFGYSNIFKNFIKHDDNKNLPNKIIISGLNGIGKTTFAYHLINYLFSKNEEFKYDYQNFKINPNNKSFKLIQQLSHPNYYQIDLDDGKKMIDVEKIRKSFNFSNKSAFNDQKRIIMINNINHLSKSSANALLKIIEEPNYNLFFILIHDASTKILDTIRSRCVVFKQSFNKRECEKIFENITNVRYLEIFNKELQEFFFTQGDLIYLYKLSQNEGFVLKEANIKFFLELFLKLKYKLDAKQTNFLIKFIQIYFYKKIQFKYKPEIYDQFNHFLKKLNNSKNFNLDFDSIFLEFESKILNE